MYIITMFRATHTTCALQMQHSISKDAQFYCIFLTFCSQIFVKKERRKQNYQKVLWQIKILYIDLLLFSFLF